MNNGEPIVINPKRSLAEIACFASFFLAERL